MLKKTWFVLQIKRRKVKADRPEECTIIRILTALHDDDSDVDGAGVSGGGDGGNELVYAKDMVCKKEIRTEVRKKSGKINGPLDVIHARIKSQPRKLAGYAGCTMTMTMASTKNTHNSFGLSSFSCYYR